MINSGGAKIEKYIIQKKDKFKPEWENAAEVPGDQLTGKVKDLKERGEYQFRIIAVNKGIQKWADLLTKITNFLIFSTFS